VICFTEVRFLPTYSPLRWSQRPGLFQPFPSLKRSLRPSELLFSSNGTLSPHKDHHTIGVSCFGYNWIGIKKEWRRKAIQTQELKRTQLSLSLVTIWLEWSLDLGEDLISCLCLVLNIIALVWGVKAENLDAMNDGWLGVFIAPTTKRAIAGGCCRMVHRTVRCATEHCPVRQPHHPVVGFWPLELLTAGPPDSPVVHRTVTHYNLLCLLWRIYNDTRHICHKLVLFMTFFERWHDLVTKKSPLSLKAS
jgi:hypothetical protein